MRAAAELEVPPAEVLPGQEPLPFLVDENGHRLFPFAGVRATAPNAGAESDTRLTPAWILDVVREVDEIVLDPCDHPASSTGARVRWYREDDGLARDWSDHYEGLVFVNPPYSRGQLDAWCAKVLWEVAAAAEVVLLVPNDCSTRWWQSTIPKASAVCFVGRRLKFGHADGNGPKSGALFSCVLAFFGPASRARTFARVAARIGSVWFPPSEIGVQALRQGAKGDNHVSEGHRDARRGRGAGEGGGAAGQPASPVREPGRAARGGARARPQGALGPLRGARRREDAGGAAGGARAGAARGAGVASAPTGELEVECPSCKAARGEFCRNYKGTNCAPHGARTRARAGLPVGRAAKCGADSPGGELRCALKRGHDGAHRTALGTLFTDDNGDAHTTKVRARKGAARG